MREHQSQAGTCCSVTQAESHTVTLSCLPTGAAKGISPTPRIMRAEKCAGHGSRCLLSSLKVQKSSQFLPRPDLSSSTLGTEKGNNAAFPVPCSSACHWALKPLVLGWGLGRVPSTSTCSVEVRSGQTPGGALPAFTKALLAM